MFEAIETSDGALFVEIQVPSSPLSCSLLEDRESGGFKMWIMSSRSLNFKLIDVREILLVTTT